MFGPILDGTGSWGLAVVETDDEDALRAHVEADPAVTTGTAGFEFGRMLQGFVRPAAG